ncbi:GNAT family N-acetyltransferase [Alkalihalobacillus sp. NPDC078783]
MNWKIKLFQELSTSELYTILQARVDVFVVEQNCAYEEVDGNDQEAIHVAGYVDDKLAAYCRLFLPSAKRERASIGRVLVTKEFRRSSYGKDLMAQAIHTLEVDFKQNSIQIQAQYYLDRFYRSFGFEPISEVYLLDEIDHVDMVRKKGE